MNSKKAFITNEGKAAVHAFYDNLLQQWPEPNEKFYVHTRFGETFIIACGKREAPPLILLHGSAMNSAMWASDAIKYSETHRVYAVDIPGEPGRSDKNQLSFTGGEFADWLADVCKELKIEKADLTGISLGGWLALKFALSYPDKVNKLALLCPAGVGPQKKSFLFKAVMHMLFGEKGMEALYVKVNGNQPLPEIILQYQRLIAKNFNFRRETIPLFTDAELKQLKVPAIVFLGEKDIMFHSNKTADRFIRLMPQAKVNVLPGVGHTLINLSDRISEFLKPFSR